MRPGSPVDPLKDLALARSAHDRAAEHRSDAAALEHLWSDPSTRVLRVHDGRIAYAGESIEWIGSSEAGEGERYFLGVHDECAYFAVDLGQEIETSASLREVGALLDDLEVGLVVQAVALSLWHDTHPRCARCGAPTACTSAGYSRTCTACAAEHYPRTDPAVIVLVQDSADRILLGRQAVWPRGRFSTFAGFVEPGESFESAVVREVGEEAGVTVDEIAYLGSQPWPFPASLMIAFTALARDPEQAEPDGTEIEQVRWFTRTELSQAIAAGEIILPPSVSVARRMIEAWYGGALSGGEAWR